MDSKNDRFYFAFIFSLLCFCVNWNVFLTNIRHVFLGAQRDRLSEMVLLSRLGTLLC